jgi:hypothetical protein
MVTKPTVTPIKTDTPSGHTHELRVTATLPLTGANYLARREAERTYTDVLSALTDAAHGAGGTIEIAEVNLLATVPEPVKTRKPRAPRAEPAPEPAADPLPDAA